jgi:polyhydroxyalkanoate synthase
MIGLSKDVTSMLDATRMPYRMHSEYLRRLFLNNDLYEGRYEVGGEVISLSDIHVPVFIVSTIKDHVAPWRSVFKFHLMSDAETITFVLTSGGHNAGIVSEPGHAHRTFQIYTHREGDRYIGPDRWRKKMPIREGLWWIPWEEWLAQHSSGQVNPPEAGSRGKGYSPLCDAPGTYVLMP